VEGVFGVMSMTNEFDEEGRLIQRTLLQGALGEDVTMFTYNEHSDVTEQSELSTSREMSLDPAGPKAKPDVTRIHDTLFSYEYDPHCNWTSRIVAGRFVKEGSFETSNVERREIEYHGQT
jgi:hypothetical protein